MLDIKKDKLNKGKMFKFPTFKKLKMMKLQIQPLNFVTIKHT